VASAKTPPILPPAISLRLHTALSVAIIPPRARFSSPHTRPSPQQEKQNQAIKWGIGSIFRGETEKGLKNFATGPVRKPPPAELAPYDAPRGSPHRSLALKSAILDGTLSFAFWRWGGGGGGGVYACLAYTYPNTRFWF
jgi:hypothetical protein